MMNYGFRSKTKLYGATFTSRKPDAQATIIGSYEYPSVYGMAMFYQMPLGILVVVEAKGLPFNREICAQAVYGVHIHDGTSCTGTKEDPFADAKKHYNPFNCDHPHHAGDLPPLFGNDGYAWNSCFTNRFYLRDIIGKTIIIHKDPDDFTTQPAGNSGQKIACGVIYKR